MTEFERNERYSFSQKFTYLKNHGYDSEHLRTICYNGYNVIMLSKLQQGVAYYFYIGERLVKMRWMNWKNDIEHCAKLYIERELKKNTYEAC